MVISEYWLEPFDFIDFADFANQWQKEVDQRLYDDRPDLYYDGIVNFRDFAVLANEWGMTGSAEPNIQIDITGDGSNGYVEVGISNYTLNTSQAFLLVDGQYSERFGGFENGEHELVNVAALGPGPHQFKVVSLDSNSNITCSHIKETSFNTPFNYCLCNEAYEVNKPLYFCAYVPDNNEDVCVKAVDDDNNVLWTQTYTGGNLNGFIPDTNTRTLDIDRIIFEKNPAGGMVLMNGRGSNSSVSLSVTPSFDPKNISPNVRALVVLPTVRWYTWTTKSAIKDALNATKVEFYELAGSEASSNNLAWFAQNRNIEYLYFNGHGYYQTAKNGTLRTALELSDGIAFSCKQNDYSPGNIPPWCKKLASDFEITGNSVKAMGFHTIKFAFLDGCFTGHLTIKENKLVEGKPGSEGIAVDIENDMALALGVEYSNLFYQGWDANTSDGSTSSFSKFTKDEWNELGEGVHTFYEAIKTAVDESLYDRITGRYPNEDVRLSGRTLYFYTEKLK